MRILRVGFGEGGSSGLGNFAQEDYDIEEDATGVGHESQLDEVPRPYEERDGRVGEWSQ